MKVYFTAAISNVSEKTRELYREIVSQLEKLGHSVIVSEATIGSSIEIKKQSEKEALMAQRKLSQWKKQADVVLVEASNPSFGVGQEITEALADNKQVLLMYLRQKPHILINQNQEAIYIVQYKPETINKVLRDCLEYAKENSDTRFNFFISPQIGAYLDWIARRRKIPRAVYLRRLIEQEMKENKEYNL